MDDRVAGVRLFDYEYDYRRHEVFLPIKPKFMTKFEKKINHHLIIFINKNVAVDHFCGNTRENEPKSHIYTRARK